MSTASATDLTTLLRQQESLRGIIESISSELELRPLLTLIVRHACDLLGAANGTMGLVDEQRNVVVTEAVYQMPADELGAEFAPGVGLFGLLLLNPQPIILARYGDIHQPTQTRLADHRVIGLPILWRGQVIGVFGLGSPPPRQFTEQDAEILALFAKHAAIAIVNARLFADTQRILNETRLLYTTSQRISVAIDVDDVVQAYLEQVATRGHYACNIALYSFNEAGERTAVTVRGRWTPAEGLQWPLLLEVPNIRDALDPVLDAGQTITSSNVHTDPRIPKELRQLQAQDQRPALALIPLMARGRRIGLVILSYPAVHEWSEADLHAYQITAAQLATAIDSRQQISLLAQHNQQLAVWEERRRLARELHDSVTQLIFSMTLIAQSIGPAWRRNPSEGEQRVQRLLELSQATLAEMRALLVELRPTELGPPMPYVPPLFLVQQQGLLQALRQHIASLARDGLPIELTASDYHRLPVNQEETLFRIAQEALNNAVKHAQASQVNIRLTTQQGATKLTIQDNGIGFVLNGQPIQPVAPIAPQTAPPVGGLGLQTMRERAELLGGKFQVTTAPGQGTQVVVVLPCW
ncbi:MAG: GAF domain-containing sensor histidine kinase [Caldilineaceae bacterium]